MISQRCRRSAWGSVLIRVFTSARDRWEAAWVTRAISSVPLVWPGPKVSTPSRKRRHVALFRLARAEAAPLPGGQVFWHRRELPIIMRTWRARLLSRSYSPDPRLLGL